MPSKTNGRIVEVIQTDVYELAGMEDIDMLNDFAEMQLIREGKISVGSVLEDISYLPVEITEGGGIRIQVTAQVNSIFEEEDNEG